MTDRLVWIRCWAQGWKETLQRRKPEEYYAHLGFEVAVDMVLELVERVERLERELVRAQAEASDWAALSQEAS